MMKIAAGTSSTFPIFSSADRGSHNNSEDIFVTKREFRDRLWSDDQVYEGTTDDRHNDLAELTPNARIVLFKREDTARLV
jgi:hypothetical protein